jgi:predicted kinase
MVLNEVYNIIYSKDYSFLNIEDKKSLILAAIFHDIGKTLTTKKENRNGLIRIVSPRHEDKGANYIASRLIDYDLNHSTILKTINLVRYHQLPKMLIIKNYLNFNNFLSLANNCSLELYYLFGIADIKGRNCNDKEEQLDYIELFKIYSIDFKIFTEEQYNIYVINLQKNIINLSKNHAIQNEQDLISYSLNELSKGNIFTAEEGVYKFLKYNNNAKVIILSGISGSGKSTSLVNFLDYDIINLDKIRKKITKSEDDQSKNPEVLRLAYEKLRENLRKKRNTVFDATNLRKDFRMKIFDLCDKYNSLTEIIFFESSINQSLKNIKQRERKISIDVLEKQVRDLQLPELFETRLRTKYINKINI